METSENSSFGVFKPVGHLVISFPSAAQSAAAAQALAKMDLPAGAVRQLTDREMLGHIERDLAVASPVASVGQELNLVLAHKALAERGYHWLVVHAPALDLARRVADVTAAHGAERAQRYGNFIIEEMVEHRSDLPQVAESPDRGLDAQAPSGDEAGRAGPRPR